MKECTTLLGMWLPIMGGFETMSLAAAPSKCNSAEAHAILKSQSKNQLLLKAFLWLSRDRSEVAPHDLPTPVSPTQRSSLNHCNTVLLHRKVRAVRMYRRGNIVQINWVIVSKILITVYGCYSPTEPLVSAANCFCRGSPWLYRLINNMLSHY